MKLIDKDAIMAKIEKRFDEYSSSILKHYDAYTEARASELGKILVILNTIEVKEVNLENEIDNWYNTIGIPVTTYALKETAKHFFELGLQVNNPITAADQENEWNESSIKPPFTITMNGNKYSKPMLCYDKFGNYCIAQYVRLQTGYCGWYDSEEEVCITHWKELKVQKGE